MKRFCIPSTRDATLILLAATTMAAISVNHVTADEARPWPLQEPAEYKAVTNDALSGKAIIIVGGKEEAPPVLDPGPLVSDPQPFLRRKVLGGDETRLNPQPLPPKETPIR